MNRLEEILREKREEIKALRPRRDELHQAALLRNDFADSPRPSNRAKERWR